MSIHSGEPSPSVRNFIHDRVPRVGLTKADAAYAEIRESILTCALEPGAVIDQEMIAEWIGSSTTPVREALRRLASEQLVVMRSHSEPRVAQTSVQEFREFHLVRLGLEPLAAEVATKMASDDVIEMLRPLVMPDAGTPDVNATGADPSRTFHQAIYRSSGNETLTQILDSIWDRAGRYRVILARMGSTSVCDSPEHQKIFTALETRDRSVIAKLVYDDIEASYRQLLPALERALEEDAD